ncbi:MAG: STAS domain-containing protein [Woeseiaceae bacterium]|nr:STAS domain-containing protein [Woeseiaceae bacterium]
MFEIDYGADGVVVCTGRLDAAQCAKAEAFMDGIKEDGVLDFGKLEYISSAGLGILLKTQKRLATSGAALKIINVNNHIHDVFRYSGFHAIFEIEARQE